MYNLCSLKVFSGLGSLIIMPLTLTDEKPVLWGISIEQIREMMVLVFCTLEQPLYAVIVVEA